MATFPLNSEGDFKDESECGFDIAVLTHKNYGNAAPAIDSLIPENTKKSRLLLISSNAVPNSINNNDASNDGGVIAPKKLKRTINRKRVTFDDTITHHEKTYRINNGNLGVKLGLYVEPLQKIIEQFEVGLAKWRRVFVLRFDLHCPFETNDNKQMTDFRKRLFQKLKRVYGFKEIGYCWAREYHGKGKGQHYHWVLFLDANVIRHSSRIIELIISAWSKPTGGYHAQNVKRPFYLVDSDYIVQEAIYRVSYLAKTRGKGYRSEQTKDYQCSRMKA